MRFHICRLLIFKLAAFSAGAALQAQVFELSGGASTLYGAQGASVLIHGGGMETSIGAGLSLGRFTAGGSSILRLKDKEIVAGQQEFSMDLPTDVFDSSHIFFGTGVGLHESILRSDSLNAFAGLSSAEAGSPLFQSVSLGRIAGFAQWKRSLSRSCFSVSTALLSKAVSLFQSAECSLGPKIRFSATAGRGRNARYEAFSVTMKRRRLNLRASYIDHGREFRRGDGLDQPISESVRENVSAEYQLTSRVSLAGMHRNYVTPEVANDEYPSATELRYPLLLLSSLDEASLRYGKGHTDLNLTILRSSSRQMATSEPSGFSGGNLASFTSFSHSFGPIRLTESFLHSASRNGPGSSVLISSISASINPHLRVTESLNVTNNGTTMSHGGVILMSFSSLSVDYQTLYLPNRTSNPFQQALVLDTRLRLFRNTWLQAETSLDSAGKTLYSFRVGTILARNASTPDPISSGGLGVNVLHGRVVNPDGDPIEGAAVMVGVNHLYSDTQGYFFYREKVAHTHPFRVIPSEFVGVGSYVVVSSPSEVRTSSSPDTATISVVVRRAATQAQQLISVNSTSTAGEGVEQ